MYRLKYLEDIEVHTNIDIYYRNIYTCITKLTCEK